MPQESHGSTNMITLWGHIINASVCKMLPWEHAPLIKGDQMYIYTHIPNHASKKTCNWAAKYYLFRNSCYSSPFPQKNNHKKLEAFSRVGRGYPVFLTTSLWFQKKDSMTRQISTPRMFPSRRMNWNCSKAKSRPGNLNSLVGWRWTQSKIYKFVCITALDI